MTRSLLVTGGAGFIGSCFVRMVLRERPDWCVINLDALTYSGNPDNLADLDETRHRFVRGDICDRELVESLMGECDAVVHMAAESHVDRSIEDASPFLKTNVLGTQVLLDAFRRNRDSVERFVLVSTDEVYGSLPLENPEARFTERSPIDPRSPYAASKAGGDLLALSYAHTFGLDIRVTRCSNNLGPRQFPEKVIPLFVTNLMRGKRVPLYGDGLNVRDWIHVEDHCQAVLDVLERGRAGEVYNVGADNERSNVELTHAILAIMGHDESMIEHVADRLGHDRRYAIDSSKIQSELGWTASRSAWPDALESTVQWYRENETWWERILQGEHQNAGIA